MPRDQARQRRTEPDPLAEARGLLRRVIRREERLRALHEQQLAEIGRIDFLLESFERATRGQPPRRVALAAAAANLRTLEREQLERHAALAPARSVTRTVDGAGRPGG